MNTLHFKALCMHVVGLRADLSHVVAEKKTTVESNTHKKQHKVINPIMLYANALYAHKATDRGKLKSCKYTYLSLSFRSSR